MAKLELAYEDKTSATWSKIKRHLESELAILREKNDSTGLSYEETLALRGEIQRIKAILSVDGEKPKFRPSVSDVPL